MLRFAAKIACALAGVGSGIFVYRTMGGVFEGWVPRVAAGIVALVVFVILYFPLARPIVDAISDKLSTAVHRGRHIRSGSGLEELQTRPSSVLRCTICGEGEGPICEKCQAELDRRRRPGF